MSPHAKPDGTTISLAYSVDADDAFMFHALAGGQVAAPGIAFSHRRADTAELNRIALGGGADVVAISAGLYPRIASRYLLLPHGASVGRGFGPVVVAPREMVPAGLAGRRVGIPGLTTTAWMVLQLIEPRAIPVEIPIVPFNAIFDALASGQVDAALLIHEGRLIYPERGLRLVELCLGGGGVERTVDLRVHRSPSGGVLAQGHVLSVEGRGSPRVGKRSPTAALWFVRIRTGFAAGPPARRGGRALRTRRSCLVG